MPTKTKPQPDDPEQFKRFIKTAKELEADESDEAFERAFGKVVTPITPTPSAGSPDGT